MTELKALFARVLDIDEEQVSEQTSRDNTEEWDSFNHLLLMYEIEAEFNVRFTTEEVTNVRTFEDLAKILHSKG